MAATTGVFDWLFRNRHTGAITIAQFPNLALWIVIGAAAVRLVLPDDSALRGPVGVVGLVGLAWWSADELVRGVNPWRRILGAAGAWLTVAGVVELVT